MISKYFIRIAILILIWTVDEDGVVVGSGVNERLVVAVTHLKAWLMIFIYEYKAKT